MCMCTHGHVLPNFTRACGQSARCVHAQALRLLDAVRVRIAEVTGRTGQNPYFNPPQLPEVTSTNHLYVISEAALRAQSMSV